MSKVKIGIIGGSGLNDPAILSNGIERHIETPFGSPSDVVIEGSIKGVEVAILPRHGKKHSINPSNINYRANIWALKSIGCTHVITSSATGSLKEEIKPGDFVILDQFIDRTSGTRKCTFFDGGENSFPGVTHIPMEPIFCNRTRNILIEAGKELGIPLHTEGTLVCIEGPRFSTKAESNLYRSWGAHVVGMTLVPEVILAKEAGLLYGTVAMATDYDCWHNTVVDVNEVLKTFKCNVEKMIKLFILAIEKIGQESWDDTIDDLKNVVKSGGVTQE